MNSLGRAKPRSQSGVALLLTLLIFLILAAVVSELVISSRLDYEVAKNDSNLARLDVAIESVLIDALDLLRQDGVTDASSGQTAPGGVPAADPAGQSGQQQGPSDSSEDEWAKDTDKTLGDVRVTIHIEDENRKFNILSLLSPDEAFAKLSLERLTRIIDRFREDTYRDIDSTQAETLANAILVYLKGTERPDGVPKAALMTTTLDDQRSPMLTIDELLFVKGITEDLLYDYEERDERNSQKIVYPGLASLLTVWTALQPYTPGGGANAANANAANNAANNAQNQGQGQSQANSFGVKINVNTAARVVLKSLFPEQEMPPDVIEGIVKYRNIEQENTDTSSSSSSGNSSSSTNSNSSSSSNSNLYGTSEEKKPMQYFASLEDLSKVNEYMNFADQKTKDNFRKLISVRSDVFSVYLTARLVDSEGATTTPTETNGEESADAENGKLVRRMRAVFWRKQAQNGVDLVPVVPWEVRRDKKILLRDFAPDQMPKR